MGKTSTPELPHFARTLRRLREEAGLSVTDLSREASVDRGYLWHLERGTKEPSLEVARRLGRALGCGLAAFDEPGK
jgi:transcriptional regulator with XRE-family HTH domain